MRTIPKIIEGLQPALIKEARSMLLEDGGRALTIRNVAARCHVAVGTVYNYFGSKDELMAHVMLEDWRSALAAMHGATREAPDVLAGLRSAYDILCGFADMYRAAWRNYAANNDAMNNIIRRHGLLIAQLTEVVSPLLERFAVTWDSYLPIFIAEMLLSASIREAGNYQQVLPILTRIVQP